VRGYEGAKKQSGRKRHLLVDTLRMVLKALRCTRRTSRTEPRCRCRWKERPRSSLALKHLWVDQGYTGAGKEWIEEQLGWSVEVVKHPPKARGEW